MMRHYRRTRSWLGRLVMVTLVLWVSSATARPANSDDSVFARTDAYVREQMARSPIPGLAYGIVKGDRVLHLQAFGRADPSGRPVTSQTPFVISSVTKTFTALAVRQQINAGKLDLDAPVQRYLPWFRVADEVASRRITVGMLLNHRSGFGRRAGEQPYLNDPQATLEGLVRSLAPVELDHAPGVYEYSNLNDLVLGLIVEQLSGMPYDAYVERNIFTPLDMRNSYTSQVEAERNGLAVGHRLWFGMLRPTRIAFPVAMHPAGYLISSADDMARYLTTYYTGGPYGDVSVLAPQGVPAPAVLPNQLFDGYWNPGPSLLWNQSGGSANYNSDLMLAQAQRLGVIVLLNSRPDTLVPAVTAYDIALGITRIM